MELYGDENIQFICLRLTFEEIPHTKIWVSWGMLFKALGVQTDTQTPCWLRIIVSFFCHWCIIVIIHISGGWVPGEKHHIFQRVPSTEIQVILPMTDWMGPGKLVLHMHMMDSVCHMQVCMLLANISQNSKRISLAGLLLYMYVFVTITLVELWERSDSAAWPSVTQHMC